MLEPQDMHVISLLQELTIAEAAQTPGHGNLLPTSPPGTDFIPLVAEALGGLAEDTISTISWAIDNRCGTPDSAHSKH